MSRQLLAGLTVITLLVVQSSCIPFRKSTRKPTASTVPAVVPVDTTRRDTLATVSASNGKQALVTALSAVWRKDIAFNTFNGKAKMHYEGKGQKQDFTTNFRIKKDQAIWATVTALGGIVQVARVYITPDTLKLINYLDKQVIIMPLSEAGKVLPVPADFSTLQNLIIGNAVRQTGTPADAADMGNLLVLQVDEPNVTQQINYNKQDTSINSIQLRASSLGGPSGTIQFSDYTLIDNRRFSNNRNINFANGADQYYLEMNFNKVDFDQPVDFPFSIPKNYRMK